MHIDKKVARKRLSRMDIWRALTFDNLHEMHAIANDEDIKSQIENRIIRMASEDGDLFSIIKNETDSLAEKAWEKLKDKIEKGLLRKAHARKILFKIFKYVTERRVESWRILKTLNPTVEELKKFIDLDCMRGMPNIQHEAERLARKRHIRKVFNAQKTIKRIKKLS